MRLQPVYTIAEICALKNISEAVVCPGSRCAPLTIAFVRHEKINVRTISDERSAAFIALGIAQQTKKPVVLICTSGSAAYNFAPAIAEAYYQQIPLIVITADRPTEWIGQRDGQTIAQQGLYGRHVKAHYQLSEEYEHADSLWSFYRMVNEALNTSMSSPHGPVHLNVPLREPLYPEKGDAITFDHSAPSIELVRTTPSIAHSTITEFSDFITSGKKVLVVVGQCSFDAEMHVQLRYFFQNFNIPVIGDIISNLHPLSFSILHTDGFLIGMPPQEQALLKPDVLITLGKSSISKNLKLFLRKNKATIHWHVEEGETILDPFQSITKLIAADPVVFLQSVNQKVKSYSAQKEYHQVWSKMEESHKQQIHAHFQGDTSSEMSFVKNMFGQLPVNADLHLANSLSVRYANWVGLTAANESTRVYSNRGTSGIDGCTSTAVGHALSTDRLTVLLTGDLAFFYDRNAFWHRYKLPNLRVVILNNHGGAIFGVIDGPGSVPELNDYFITSQNLSAQFLATEFGIAYYKINTGWNEQELQKIFAAFFLDDGQPKILELESNSLLAQQAFTSFKKKIKQSYGT